MSRLRRAVYWAALLWFLNRFWRGLTAEIAAHRRRKAWARFWDSFEH